MNELEKAIKDMASSFNVKIEFNADSQLLKYKKGDPLSFNELKEMSDGTAVWVTYKKYGDEEYRINNPYVIKKCPNNIWALDDGSSFVCEFTPWERQQDSEQCFNDCSGEGEMYVWKAIE